ncbi:MAG: PIN domain-containing protein [Acidimicrobiia bacterium]|nr:PIN domain-containing protein [Acidimicrobiia bacterium]
MLVDTSVWIEYLRATGTPHHLWVRGAITHGDLLGWTDPILFELTVGARGPARVAELRSLLLSGPMLAVEGVGDWEAAARLHRAARAQGLTVRSTVDCLIAAVAIRTGVPVMARDRDFVTLAQVSDLELLVP